MRIRLFGLSIDAVSEDCQLPYWVKRILLKSGEIVTEELGRDANYFPGAAAVMGDVITVCCGGRQFDAKVVEEI
ncbi:MULTISPECIES: hypothetical protein [Bradyrhizobium]|uniref:hypothetical protein n=1 Tax=Bradyrhizobium TaxID=374 RepID=UPI00155E5800|nr:MULTISPECIES: hypothetical protein [Bradyrhizobium]UUO30466.1 hypothetical protein DCG74_26090 [Bradyrhizobium sp. WBAH42]UWU65826.1 hypothetical protein N2602_21435 [Bradyrhizobium sp. NC92]